MVYVSCIFLAPVVNSLFYENGLFVVCPFFFFLMANAVYRLSDVDGFSLTFAELLSLLRHQKVQNVAAAVKK